MIKLIKLQDKYILLSDEEIKKGWKGYAYKHNVKDKVFKHSYTTNSWYSNAKKIIAGIPELPSIDFSLLSEEDCKTIEYNYWSRHWEIVNSQIENGVNPHAYRLGFITAQSLSDKMFSLDDIVKAIYFGEMSVKDSSIKLFEKKELIKTEVTRQFIQSLQQSSWNIVIEMELNLNGKNGLDRARFIPKIIDNSIKILKVL